MSAPGNVDLSDVPIYALGEKSKFILGLALNKLMVIPTDEGSIPRDWRGLAHLTGVNTMSLSQSKNPVADILTLWDKEKIFREEKRPSIQDLQEILGQLDRWDVYDDTAELMTKDAELYVARSLPDQPADENISKVSDSDCLTIDDLDRLHEGLPLDTYDAFLLYADAPEDKDFAAVVIDKLENEFSFRLCLKDRDLIGGVGLEFQAITKLIADRCSSLIVILSPNFLESKANMFFLTFAQALSLEQQKKKIIPCIHKPCAIPLEIKYLYCLDFKTSERYGNFWKRLKHSVEASRCTPRVPRIGNALRGAVEETGKVRCTVVEIQSEENIVESSLTQETAVVRMSDPSTHYPGKSTTEACYDEWLPTKAVREGDDVVSPDASKGKGPVSFLSRFMSTPSTARSSPKKKKKKWFKKKTEALSA